MKYLRSNKSRSSRPLQDTAIQADIIARRGAGESCESIGKSYGVSRMSIHNVWKNHEDTVNEIRKKIFAENIDNYTATLKKDVVNNYKISNKYYKEGTITPAEVAYKTTVNKAIAPILQDKGIHPSPAFAQINIDNSKNLNVDPEIFKRLSSNFNPGYIEMNEDGLVEV